MEEDLFKDRFPTIYAIAMNKAVRVSNCCTSNQDGEEVWQVVVFRNLNDWELSKYENLMRVLSDVSLGNNEDKSI